MDLKLLGFLIGVCLAQGEPPVIKEHPSNMVARRNDPATLNCAASGAARIRWFRDGEEVVTSTQDPRSHRVLLPSGSLFFLRVTATRKDSDSGTYWCVASNSYGTTRSHNATLTVATLAYDFQSQAEPTVKARVGESVSLPCRPPKATPTPELTWLRDGRQVTNSSRVSVTEAGDLVISQAILEDTATYVCRVRNVAGSRESLPTQLIIMIPPWFEERPANVTTAAGVVVELACRARGIPMPKVTWRRLNGKLPSGRARTENQHLVLVQVAAVDSDVYICEATSDAGIAVARASLSVVGAPELSHRPQHLQAMVGQATEVPCRIEGDPQPLVVWRLPTLDRSGILTPGQTSGRASVSEDGQILLLEKLTTQDSGIYYCWGVSTGGGVSGRVELVVVSAYPPPVVGVGPQDLKAAPRSVASFPCEAVSEAAAAAVTWWYRPAAHLPSRQLTQDTAHPQLALPDNGALILKDVGVEDAGIYTCRVVADTGTVQHSAVLQVDQDFQYQTQSMPLLPPPPSKPRLVAVNETAIQLSWLPNSQGSVESDQWYTVEYWRQGWNEWRVADAVLTQESCVVSHLTPGQTYTFLVRAVSSRGASFPSPWSDPVITRPPRDPSLTVDQIRQAHRRLSRPIVTLIDAAITAPSSVLLTWDFLAPTDESAEGVLVYAVDKMGTVQVATVLGASSSSHLLDTLCPNTGYTFFIVPFWHSIEGTPSNSLSLVTPEDVPVVAPGDVRVTVNEEGSVLIRWSSMSAEEARGELVGYQVTISHNGSQTTETVVSPWLEARGLLPGRLYTVRVAAVTGAGSGPLSDPVLLDAGISDAHNRKEFNADGSGSVMYVSPQPAWLVYLLIPLVLLLFVATVLYVRRLRYKAPPSNPPHAPALYHDPSIYPDHHSVNMYSEQKLWRPSDTDKDSSLSSTRLLPSEQLVNEYAEPRLQRYIEETTEPYATTALLEPSSPGLEHGLPWPHHRDIPGIQVNWAAFLPPPPACPPPLDLDLGDPLSDCNPHWPRRVHSTVSQYDNMAGSEHYERPCDNTSQHTYDVYTQVTPADGLLTFNTLQSHSSRKLRPHCRSARLADHQRSNTR